MEQKAFDDVITFAIDREREAVQFYRDLQAMVQFAPRKEMLRELEDMEKGHIKALENIRAGAAAVTRKPPDVQDLKISNYLVAAKPTPEMSYQDIIITAMKREEAATQLYSDLAGRADDPELKQLFLRLAAEETKHKLHFEKIYNDEILTDN